MQIFVKMYRFLTFLSIVCCVIQFIKAMEYPSSLQRCHAGDTVCLDRVIQWYSRALKYGNSDINSVPLDPLFIKELHIVQGSESSVNINMKLKDINLYGLSTVTMKKVIGFGKNPSKSKFELYGRFKKVTLIGKYSVRGNVLILPVVGRGPVNLTLTNLDAVIKFIPKVEIKEGKEYLQIPDAKFDFKVKRLQMEFSDLFSGNRLLSQGTNRFINENSSFILREVMPAFRKALGEAFRNVASPIFAKFPYKDLFL